MKRIGFVSMVLAFIMAICFMLTGVTIAAVNGLPKSQWLWGDVNGNGDVEIDDATIIQRVCGKLQIPSEDMVIRGSISGNDGLTIVDATLIQRYRAKMKSPFPVGEPMGLSDDPTEAPTQAITGPSFVVDTVNASAGDHGVAVNVSVKNNPGVAAIALDISYNTSKLKLTGFSYNTEALEGASTTPYNENASVPCLYMVNGTKNITGDFVFATMYFDVLDNVYGNGVIELTYDEDNVYDITETNIDFDVINGAVVIYGNEPTEPVSGKHTVVFKDYDGRVISSQLVEDGKSAQAPENPSRNGYTFLRWDTAFDNVKSDLTVNAVYQKLSDGPTFIIENVNANPGDTNVPVTVAVKNNPGVSAIALDIIYDKSNLTLKNFTYNTSALAGASTTPYNANAFQPCLFMVNGTQNIEGDFTFATMYFDVSSQAEGICPITVVYDEDNVYNIDEDNIAFEIADGAVNVSK